MARRVFRQYHHRLYNDCLVYSGYILRKTARDWLTEVVPVPKYIYWAYVDRSKAKREQHSSCEHNLVGLSGSLGAVYRSSNVFAGLCVAGG
jgi:hypothetical protein